MSKPRILIVEDEAAVARDLSHQLLTLGYEVAGETRQAEDAVGWCERLRPSLVLMDIHLAGATDGIAAAQLIRERCAIPVVFLTALAGDAVVERAKHAQPYGYVVKPIDERELRTVIEMALYKHQAAEALRESNDLLRRAQEVARLGSYKYDLALDAWSSTPQLDQIFGIEADYRRNADGWLQLVAPEQREEMRTHLLRHVLAERRRFEKEYRIVRHSDRQERWVSGLGELECDSAGQPVRLVGTIQDITERKQLELQLRQAQKMEVVGQLAGGVAHDFNNILTAISLNLEMMRYLDLPEAAAASVGELEGLTRRATRLTQQLLMFARRQAIQVAPVEVNAAMTGLLKMLRRLLGEHITLNFVSAPTVLWIEADPGMLDQAVMNLCVNARDAMPGGGQLTLATARVTLAGPEPAQPEARAGRFVCISVSDTGTGMPPEVLQHLFEPFFTTKEIGKGTGLGLASVHGIVHQHQGWITVQSVVGRGTTFRIFLPAAPREGLAGMVAEEEAPVPGGRETLLLVEDEPVVRQVAAMMLERLGYRVLTAADGPEAIRLGEEHAAEIALIVADMVMPGGLTGLQVGQRLQARKPSLKILLVSGYSSEIIRGESLADQGVTFLSKPFETKTLAETIRRCLDN